MNQTNIDSIILGHNPFFGIDHLSQETGNAKSLKFGDVNRIIDMLFYCHELGVRGMMMSTHPRATAVCNAVAKEHMLASKWRLYPLVPYIQKYIRGANEIGLMNMLMDTLAQADTRQKLQLLIRGSQGILSKDIQRGLNLLVDIELLPFKGHNLGAVFLHDALTDLALGLGVESVLKIFRDYISTKYNVPAGFITKNLPLLRARLAALGWANPLIMASFNAVGFQVTPSLEACVRSVREPNMTFVAMSTLAAGYLTPDEAYRFLARFPTIASVVVGMSRRRHAAETIEAIRQHMRFDYPGSNP
jgi:hypothetical protein